jgi:hypothetical protein
MIASATSLLEDSVGYYVEQPFIYQIGYPIVLFIAAYALREALILLLWQAVVRTLNADPSELDSLIHGRL